MNFTRSARHSSLRAKIFRMGFLVRICSSVVVLRRSIPRIFNQVEDNACPSDSHQYLFSNWCRALEDYTGRQISFPEKDKLAALAGVTREFERLLNDRCVAGMFVSDLALALLWESSSSCATVVSERPYRGPSGSWARVDGLISFGHALSLGTRRHELTNHIDILSAVATPADMETPLGQLVSAELVMSGYAVNAEWIYDEEEQYMDVNLKKQRGDAISLPPLLGQIDNLVQHRISTAGAIAVLVVILVGQSAFKGLLLSPGAQSVFQRVEFWWKYQDHIEILKSFQRQSKTLRIIM
jgi:hypothetical protein